MRLVRMEHQHREHTLATRTEQRAMPQRGGPPNAKRDRGAEATSTNVASGPPEAARAPQPAASATTTATTVPRPPMIRPSAASSGEASDVGVRGGTPKVTTFQKSAPGAAAGRDVRALTAGDTAEGVVARALLATPRGPTRRGEGGGGGPAGGIKPTIATRAECLAAIARLCGSPDDVERLLMQAPAVGIACAFSSMRQGAAPEENSFSFSVAFPKLLGDGEDTDASVERLSRVWIAVPPSPQEASATDTQLFELSPADGLDVISEALAEFDRVEFVSFNFPLLLVPLSVRRALCGYGGAASVEERHGAAAACSAQGGMNRPLPRRFNDIRVMAWMIAPHLDASHFDIAITHAGSALPAGVGIPASWAPPSTALGAGQRVAALEPMFRHMYAALVQREMLPAYLKVEKDMPVILSRMKVVGFAVSREGAVHAATQAAAEQEETLNAIRKALPVEFVRAIGGAAEFNPGSVDDCRRVLYDELRLDRFLADGDGDGMDGVSMGADAPQPASVDVTHVCASGKLSTAEDTLRCLERHHPLPRLILRHRKLVKVQSTYFEGVLDLAMPAAADAVVRRGTARVGAPTGPASAMVLRPNFLQDGTDTGRFSCAEPNIQNLPRTDDDFMGVVRKAFIPRMSGHVLVSFDYEQVELRVLAHVSGDPTLRAVLSGKDPLVRDIHRKVASVIFRKSPADVQDHERSVAKRVVFGVAYGIGPRALAAQLGESVSFATKIQQSFRSSFPLVDRAVADVVATCRRTGHVRTLLNRWRPIPGISDLNRVKRGNAERQAFNTVIQGSAADIVKKAMVDCYRMVAASQPNTLLVSQCHDELIFSMPAADMMACVAPIRMVMESCVELQGVPLVVKVSSGPNLGSLA